MSDVTVAQPLAAEMTFPRGPIAMALVMLFVSALPDALVVPLLNELFVVRYGVGAAAAHWFMAINLIGAVAVLPLLVLMRRCMTSATILLIAAATNALLLTVMWLPIGFAATIGVRFVEGAADLLVFAVLFDLLAKAGTQITRGRRLGIAGMVLMFGLACGMVLGGTVAGDEARKVFLIGGVACGVVALAAAIGWRWLNGLVSSCPVVTEAGAIETKRRPLWPVLGMVFSDRAIAGLMAATLPLYFSSVAGLGPVERGWLIGVPLLMMALGAWPAGFLGDRIGHLKLRTIAALLYAGAIAVVTLAADMPFAMCIGVMALVGAGGAALLPTSLALATGSGRGSLAMGAYRSSGDVGYLIGIAMAGTLLAILGGESPNATTFAQVILGFAAVHLVVTTVTAIFARPR